MDVGLTKLFVHVCTQTWIPLGLEAPQDNEVGHGQIYRVNGSVHCLNIRTVYLGQRTYIESLGQATKPSSSSNSFAHHQLQWGAAV